MSTVTGQLEHVERLRTSTNGNPRFDITLGGETYRTQSDASVSYEVTNYRIGRRVSLTLSRAGLVIGMEYAS